jgi:N-formylglutamate amidohydrolase
MFLIPDLSDELLKMTDRYCDELFEGACDSVIFPVSRLVCDPERFRSDSDEPMAKAGMGAVYCRSYTGNVLRRISEQERECILRTWYDPHHARLANAVRKKLDDHGRCLVIDCHSFSPLPLPHEPDQRPFRPDFCIGTDPFHTPPALMHTATAFLEKLGFLALQDSPFSGTLVPMEFYRRDPRVSSIMIEVNRALYMEQDGKKNACFSNVRDVIQSLLKTLSDSF